MDKYSRWLRYLFILVLLWVVLGLPGAWLYGHWKSPDDGAIYIIVYGNWAILYAVLWLACLVVLLASFRIWKQEQGASLLMEKRRLAGWMRLHLLLAIIPIIFIGWLQLRAIYEANKNPLTPANCPTGITCE